MRLEVQEPAQAEAGRTGLGQARKRADRIYRDPSHKGGEK